MSVKHLWGTHLLFSGDGGVRNNTEGEQTTNKWEADEHAKRQLKKTQRVLLTPYCQQQGSWDCLMFTAVHGAQVVGGMQKPHDKGERAVGFMVSTTTGTGGR